MPLIAVTRPTWLSTRSARPTATPPWHMAPTPTTQHLLVVPGSLRTWAGSLEAVRDQTLLPPLLWKARIGPALGLWSVFFLLGSPSSLPAIHPQALLASHSTLAPSSGCLSQFHCPHHFPNPFLGLPVTASQVHFSCVFHVCLSEIKGSVLGIKSAFFRIC